MKRKVTCLITVSAQIVAGLLFLLCALLYLPLALIASVVWAAIRKIGGRANAASHETPNSASPVSLIANHPE